MSYFVSRVNGKIRQDLVSNLILHIYQLLPRSRKIIVSGPDGNLVSIDGNALEKILSSNCLMVLGNRSPGNQ